jgi:hypothetical protein
MVWKLGRNLVYVRITQPIYAVPENVRNRAYRLLLLCRRMWLGGAGRPRVARIFSSREGAAETWKIPGHVVIYLPFRIHIEGPKLGCTHKR